MTGSRRAPIYPRCRTCDGCSGRASRARGAYYPFGVGQRRCIGEPVSLVIAQLTLAMLAARYDVTHTGEHPPRGRYAMTYQPRDGLPVTLTPRRPG